MNGVVLYRGPSKLDGKPIVVIATGLKAKSNNAKTGDMIQTWILREDISPTEAVKNGEDYSICGSCPHRGDGTGKGRSCYVTLFQAPLNVWKSYHRGIYPQVDAFTARQLFAGRMVRLGSYGDPAAAPYSMWKVVTASAKGWTGYTHQWKLVSSNWSALVMASADTVHEMQQAQALGYRTFRVSAEVGQVVKGLEVICPASAEAGHKTECASCKACMGTSGKAKASIVIAAHGNGATNFKRKVAA